MKIIEKNEKKYRHVLPGLAVEDIPLMTPEIEEKLKQKGVSCVYFPYTKSVSTKSIKEKIREEYKGSER